MTKKELEEIEKWEVKTKQYFNKHMKTWMDDGWSRKVAFREAYTETLQYLKERKK